VVIEWALIRDIQQSVISHLQLNKLLYIGGDVDRKVIILDACVVIHAFDSDAEQHVEARDLVKILKEKNFRVVMPMHGFFEIQCAMKRMTRVEGRTIKSPFNEEVKGLQITPQPIDHKFIENYFEVDIPYAKAGDSIYMVMAKKLGLPLVTRDKGMYKVSKRAGINVLTISEALNV
jgi:predicted nucleic acid-binding protein